VKASRQVYVLDEQIGFILRQVSQRHAVIFARDIGAELTPTQWAALAKLAETGPCSQNQLGRLTAMDVATIKGVIDRLTARGLTETSSDPEDGRRLRVSLTRAGLQLAEKVASNALAISRETLAPLDPRERELFVALLEKLR
jgi:DNA-binding MarR family transcriptional regulator